MTRQYAINQLENAKKELAQATTDRMVDFWNSKIAYFENSLESAELRSK